METNIVNNLNNVPTIKILVFRSMKRLWYVIVIPFIFGIIFLNIGWNKFNSLFLNVGIISLCLGILCIFLVVIFSMQEARKKFMSILAKSLNYIYSDYEVVFGLNTIFYNLKKEASAGGYTEEEATNAMTGFYNNLPVKFYKYTMKNLFSGTSESGSYRLDLDFFVSEIKIDHLMPNVICLPRHSFFFDFGKYKKDRIKDLDTKNYYFYSTLPIESKDKDILYKLTDFISNKDRKVGIEFCENKIIIFKYGSNINKSIIRNFFEIIDYFICYTK